METYTRLVKELGDKGVKTVADVCGCVLNEINQGLTLLRGSYADLEAAGIIVDDSQDELLAAIAKLRGKAENIVVSRAGPGCFAQMSGRLPEAKAPDLTPLDDSGAGDSMTAALAVAVAEGMTDAEALRLASAAASLNITRHGRGTGNRHDIKIIADLVEVRKVDR